MTPVILRRDRLTSGRVNVSRLRVRLEGGAEVDREVASHGDAVAVLPFDPHRRCALLVRLFRAPVFDATGGSSLEEACAGMIEDGDPEATVRREAMEELGYRLTTLEFVAKVWPSPGVFTETASLYLAPYAASDRRGAGGGLASEHENITVVERPLAELAAASDAGGLDDAKLLTLVLALRLRRPELFS